MTKSEVITKTAQVAHEDDQKVEKILNAFIATIKNTLKDGKSIYWRQFGSFQPRQRQAKVGFNFRQGKQMPLDAKTIPSFKPSPKFTDKLNRF